MKQQSLKLIFSLVFLLVSFGCSDCRVGAPTEETFREKVATEPRTLEEAPSSAGIAPGDQSSDQEASLQVAASRQPSQPSSEKSQTETKATDLPQQASLKQVLLVSPQLQEVWYYCAPTTVSMMLSARGIRIDQHTLARKMRTYEPYGTHNRDAIRILNRHLFGYEVLASGQSGYRLATVTNVDQDLALFQERLIQNIKDGYPMYYTIDSGRVYGGKPGDHNVIGIGYKWREDRRSIEYVYYLDPSTRVQDPVYGGLKIMPPIELLEATVICGEPNYGW